MNLPCSGKTDKKDSLTQRAPLIILCLLIAPLLSSCTSSNKQAQDYEEVKIVRIKDAPVNGWELISEQQKHGRYLIELLGCGSCHTDGALVGEPKADRFLAGSHIGIAYSNPLEYDYPAVVFPPNLTPDIETGIGSYSAEQVEKTIRTGITGHGTRLIPVMPWPSYSMISDEDIRDITDYLLSMEPVYNDIPDNIPAGQPSLEEFIYFGVYQSY